MLDEKLQCTCYLMFTIKHKKNANKSIEEEEVYLIRFRATAQ